MQLLAEGLYAFDWKMKVLRQFLTGALLTALLQQACRYCIQSNGSQRIVADSPPALFSHRNVGTPRQAIAVGAGLAIDCIHECFCECAWAISFKSVPGVTTSYSLPSCCITCLISEGPMDHVRM